MTEEVQESAPEKARRKLVESIAAYYIELPRYKQILSLLLVSCGCAIGFQLMHGFNALCNLSEKSGAGQMLCIGIDPNEKIPDKKLDSVLALVRPMAVKVETLSQHVLRIERAVDLLAEKTGTKEKIRRELNPRRQESLFGFNN